MKARRVIALGHDRYWLKAVRSLPADEFQVTASALPARTETWPLPPADASAVLLLEASGLANVAEMVHYAHQRGWQHILVVAANPSAREAYTVLRQAGACDYRPLTYDPETIALQVREACDWLDLSEAGKE